MSDFPQVLTIAGSDSGGGAGIQADLKTFQMRRVFGTSVITAITAQNTLGVFDIHCIPLSSIEAQIKAVAEDFNIKAVKIGMLANSDIIECVAKSLRHYAFEQIVLDPVMIAKGGASLLQPSAVNALKRYLLPLAKVITPNLPEAETLSGIPIRNQQDCRRAAEILQAAGAENLIIKGGHSENSGSTECRDYLFTPHGEFILNAKRYPTRHTHGTGCTFSACLCAELAKGHSVEAAARKAKAFISAAIAAPLNIGHGQGPTNHWAYCDE
ncbi:hydroxymethylpyrimidine/phosphomethylpyrimidine kinase [Mesocricetibacter intestinalis]|uniref:hydroxymethylpyrimidine kinase n=1 Tax=Mesocricetibacter intestinalis TaxID=1521930 RepID=A0A4R6VFL2_9PAST|nr:bifunctional hydroxymethylpyrimidine kinase/phosphomethylpyrimidine kinase [Mesocricetibacter intestinalis]TDQ59785.1 hydroxymethylpyrimidine/phosphomethylpyrimidine kinase [Mesocricetibacter intestinalis]